MIKTFTLLSLILSEMRALGSQKLVLDTQTHQRGVENLAGADSVIKWADCDKLSEARSIVPHFPTISGWRETITLEEGLRRTYDNT